MKISLSAASLLSVPHGKVVGSGVCGSLSNAIGQCGVRHGSIKRV